MKRTRLPPASIKTKRKRGGQPGNRNARVHGFYSTSLTVPETCAFWNSINRYNLDPEVAVLNVKIRSLLANTPVNRRALKEAAKLLVKWYSVKYRLDKTDSLQLKILLNEIFNRLASQLSGNTVNKESAVNAKTNRA